LSVSCRDKNQSKRLVNPDALALSWKNAALSFSAPGSILGSMMFMSLFFAPGDPTPNSRGSPVNIVEYGKFI
jgi:hypothetical protein